MLKNRILYFITLVGSVFLVLAYDQPVSFIVLYSILTLTAASFIFALVSKRSLQLSFSLDKTPVYKNETVTLKIGIKNRFFFPYPFVKLMFDERQESLFGLKNIIISLGSFQEKSVDFEIKCKFRGEYRVSVSKAETYDFLGIFKFSQIPQNYVDVTVFPIIKEVPEFSYSSGGFIESSGKKVPFSDDYSSISDIRKYQETDGMRRIHWKISAKKNEIMVKMYENIVGNSAIILLDLSSVPGDFLKSLEIEDKIIEYALSVTNALVETGTGVNFYFGNDKPVKLSCSDENEFKNLFAFIAKAQFRNESNFNDLISYCGNEVLGYGLQDKTNFIVFTHLCTNEIISSLSTLAEKNNVILFYFPKEGENYETFIASLNEIGLTVFIN